MTKRKRTNNDQQTITNKTKDWATQNPLKTGVNSGALEFYSAISLRLLFGITVSSIL